MNVSRNVREEIAGKLEGLAVQHLQEKTLTAFIWTAPPTGEKEGEEKGLPTRVNKCLSKNRMLSERENISRGGRPSAKEKNLPKRSLRQKSSLSPLWNAIVLLTSENQVVRQHGM